MTVTSKLGWLAASALGMFVVATFAGIVSAGPLDPTASPAPTQRTQNDLLPAWHQVRLSTTGGCASERFACAFGGVLDRETGLTWMQSLPGDVPTWENALEGCWVRLAAGVLGWRLPTVEELRTIFEWSGGLPGGHPFLSYAADTYWTATTDPGAPATAYVVNSANPTGTSSEPKTNTNRIWCVRGGSGYVGS